MTRHHGSTVPSRLRQALAKMAKTFQCEGCKWEYAGKGAVKKVKTLGRCSCGHVIGSARPDSPKVEPKAEAAQTPKERRWANGSAKGWRSATPSPEPIRPTAKSWYGGWNDHAGDWESKPNQAAVEKANDAADDEDEEAEPDAAKASKEEAEKKVAKLKAEESMLTES